MLYVSLETDINMLICPVIIGHFLKELQRDCPHGLPFNGFGSDEFVDFVDSKKLFFCDCLCVLNRIKPM